MTNEKAIEVLKTENCFECAYGAVSSYECDCKNCDLQRAAKMGVEALEKQIPKKPLPDERYFGIGKCTTCNAVFLDKSTNYCGNCGQAIDWSDLNEN